MLKSLVRFCLLNKLIVIIFALMILVWGLISVPFDWKIAGLPHNPVPVDAIPDIGENQQIVFTKWMGRSPQDIEDQITYPLTVSLLGMPGVKTIRSYSYFGFSTIYVIFKEDVEFYWSRSRLLEKLSSLSTGTLPPGANPILGPDATALGQVYWYTLEGRDKDGNPTGGWDLHELRTIQDWTVRYALQSADGVSEVASIGGFVQEYQIDVDPDAMQHFNVSLASIFKSVKNSNVDVGARTIEINKAEYVIRGLGFIKNIEDIKKTVIKVTNNNPVTVSDVATVVLGPAMRRGILDKGGAETVGGVVVARFGENPLATITNVKKKIEEISAGLPKKILADGRESQVTIVPFYDRTDLIYETLGTLNTALIDEILVTLIVVIIMVMHFRSSLLISGLLPLTVLAVFIAMKLFKVDANVVALSGIAIAIGTIVDMGIVLSENIIKHLQDAKETDNKLEVVYEATIEVGSAVLTAVATTVVSFLPVFTMEAAEGKLFTPLAYTKTFALVASVIIALTIIPPLAHTLFTKGRKFVDSLRYTHYGLFSAGLIALFYSFWFTGVVLFLMATFLYFQNKIPENIMKKIPVYFNYIIVFVVAWFLSQHWMPLGVKGGIILNYLFILILFGSVLYSFALLIKYYPIMLEYCLEYKKSFLLVPLLLVLLGLNVWVGFANITGFLPNFMKSNSVYASMIHSFPGLSKEFMPDLDEGSFLYMPSTMPHASIGESYDALRYQDIAFNAIPEVELVVGKLGRAESPIDPAPISMFETNIKYKSEYKNDKSGKKILYAFNEDTNEFSRDEYDNLIEDEDGKPFRQWRDHIKSPDDIWKEIIKAGRLTGTTSAPKLQPISTRIVMLQSGMRAPMGIKVKGPDLATIEKVGFEIEKLLKEVPSIQASAVFADRIVGKPYLEININRDAIARHGLSIKAVQDVIEIALGGKTVTTTVEGRERFAVRIRYHRDLRNSIEGIEKIFVSTPNGSRIPLGELSEVKFIRGPMVIKSEDTFLLGYVIFDKKDGYSEIDVVEDAQRYLQYKQELGEFDIPAGVSYVFTGSYENQIRSEKRLMLVMPISLIVIFLLLYFQFKKVPTTLLVFSGIFVAWAGGFLMLWLYGQGWFMNFELFGIDFRELFQIRPYNLSVAVWVGFLALFGIASDNGVIISTYLQQVFEKEEPKTIVDIRKATIKAGARRIRPALMTVATTLLALIPILTSTGRGSDIMIPMAIPSFGGMTIVIITVFLVPVLYCAIEERKFKKLTHLPKE